MRRRPMAFPAALMLGLLGSSLGALRGPEPKRQTEDQRQRHLAAAQAKRERRLAKRRAEIQRAQGRGQ